MNITKFFCLISILSLAHPLAAHDDALSSLPEADASYIRKHLPGIVLERISHDKPVEIAETWFPLEAQVLRFDSPASGDHLVEIEFSPTVRKKGGPLPARSGAWSMSLPGGTKKYLNSNDKTGIHAPTAVSETNGFVIKLDPPEPLVLQGLGVSKPNAREISVGIYDLHDTTDESYSGKVRCIWTDLGVWKVKVPMGTYESRLVRVEYKGSIGPASINAKKYMFLAKGIGPVAFTDMRDISAFIFFNDDTQHSGVLKKHALKNADAGASKSP
ncbi:MAG: hypothetical protein P8J45_14885 [Phycisphaerales bacterium]|nr:hypothetical protein [Phycisphaerales bacterium]